MFGERELVAARLKRLRAEVMAGMIKVLPVWVEHDVVITSKRPLVADPFAVSEPLN